MSFMLENQQEANEHDRLDFEGGFSEVFKVDIHPSRHEFYDPHLRRQEVRSSKNLNVANLVRCATVALLSRASRHAIGRTFCMTWKCSKSSAGITRTWSLCSQLTNSSTSSTSFSTLLKLIYLNTGDK